VTRDDLKRLYERRTGQPWDAEAGYRWLAEHRLELDLVTNMPVLHATAHLDLSSKASWLAQHACLVCGAGFPVSILPLRIAPESWQALGTVDKAAFKAAVAHRLAASPHVTPQHGAVCLRFVFVCSARRRVRDLDNMAKLLMDAVKGRVMGDDREADHLSLVRLAHEGHEEFVYLRIAPSDINRHRDVVEPRLHHDWADSPALRLEDFRR
jgi:Holliday junction resolvase RusA-like endonuclease